MHGMNQPRGHPMPMGDPQMHLGQRNRNPQDRIADLNAAIEA